MLMMQVKLKSITVWIVQKNRHIFPMLKKIWFSKEVAYIINKMVKFWHTQ